MAQLCFDLFAGLNYLHIVLKRVRDRCVGDIVVVGVKEVRRGGQLQIGSSKSNRLDLQLLCTRVWSDQVNGEYIRDGLGEIVKFLIFSCVPVGILKEGPLGGGERL